jgi:hypothetical protein
MPPQLSIPEQRNLLRQIVYLLVRIFERKPDQRRTGIWCSALMPASQRYRLWIEFRTLQRMRKRAAE